MLGRRVNRADPHAVWRQPTPAGERDPLVVLPEDEPAGAFTQAGVDRLLRALDRRIHVSQGFLRERVDPRDQQRTVCLGRDARPTGNVSDRSHFGESVDPLGHSTSAPQPGALLPRFRERIYLGQPPVTPGSSTCSAWSASARAESGPSLAGRAPTTGSGEEVSGIGEPLDHHLLFVYFIGNA